MEKLTYHQRLRILELDSLELRRVRVDLLFTVDRTCATEFVISCFVVVKRRIE